MAASKTPHTDKLVAEIAKRAGLRSRTERRLGAAKAKEIALKAIAEVKRRAPGWNTATDEDIAEAFFDYLIKTPEALK